ncbi:APC family permease [Flavilitoribacter nigricans]|uniref:Amino acid permease n=1 Tax=Flavilitoribacter nigricans (strain ATCC 23147 / DSM 23189 / NBRC 102662 / NCIMB 1420 / SS-2) TaxID=1122177 RepID=A0A2D0MYQ4_FLAN2|nr:APC family permease [Flavilitoribacter nigricans]PHN01019.1 amino acid permease [Flavilitoribacter nigricans DSM 23189 = NBRC 102662]
MKPQTKLDELSATAICGNDISSSCLYVSALAIIYAQQYAWLALLIVAGVLFLFRKIYGEVVGALPLNGGAYNALLNTTSKTTASLAATLTLLSYMATAVISASEAMHYVHSIWHLLPVVVATMILLAIFMGLSIMGIGESSKVATGIFIFHLFSLVLLSLFCGIFLVRHGFGTLMANYQLPVKGGIQEALFFGFAAAMLGISGFESSANFVEEQAEGVFPKTLRNMWIVVSIFNPLMAFLALSIIPVSAVADNQEALLAFLGNQASGSWLGTLISVDAALVLSGAVLTAYVGVSGLLERMTLDRILPNFLLERNRRGAPYRIVIMFFLLCVSILLITRGELAALAGVYTISFLLVMVLFGLGNVLLKLKRKRLPRPERASPLAIFLAVGAVIVAIIGNAILNPPYLGVFLEYFIPAFLLVAIMLNRTRLLRLLLELIKYLFKPVQRLVDSSNQRILRVIDEINAQEFVFFTIHDDVAVLNQVMLYITRNEHTRKLKIVSVMEKGESTPKRLQSDIEVLDREYPEIDIEFIEIEGTFGPKLIRELSKKWNIPINFMFIGSPGDDFPYRIHELGGVRLII